MPPKPVKTLRISGATARKDLGENAKLQDLQRYISEKVAGQLTRITATEKLGAALSKADAAKFHISLSWG
jgi:hypothetical protein